jgi:hypothetical protein
MDESGQRRAEAITRQVLNDWKLSAWGTSAAGSVDLSSQVGAVVAQSDQITNVNDTAAIVAGVFARAFPDRAEQFTRYTCTSVGSRLYQDLRSAGLVH